MARKKPVRKRATRSTRPRAAATRKTAPRRKTVAATRDALLAPMKGTEHVTLGGVELDIQRAGTARVKRTIYPAGFRWSTDMKSVVGTDYCMHAHVGFLARGRIHMEYSDGCIVEFKAPAVVVIDPGHEGWVVGQGPAVLIEFDFEKETVARLGMPEAHRHS